MLIELERAGCYGICPIYSLQILGDSRVQYEGQRFVLVEGTQSVRISPGQVQELVTAFENINFFALPDHLSYGIEDLEESRTCITLVSTRKCVEIRSTYPAAGLTELEKVKELDHFKQGAIWVFLVQTTRHLGQGAQQAEVDQFLALRRIHRGGRAQQVGEMVREVSVG